MKKVITIIVIAALTATFFLLCSVAYNDSLSFGEAALQIIALLALMTAEGIALDVLSPGKHITEQ